MTNSHRKTENKAISNLQKKLSYTEKAKLEEELKRNGATVKVARRYDQNLEKFTFKEVLVTFPKTRPPGLKVLGKLERFCTALGIRWEVK